MVNPNPSKLRWKQKIGCVYEKGRSSTNYNLFDSWNRVKLLFFFFGFLFASSLAGGRSNTDIAEKTLWALACYWCCVCVIVVVVVVVRVYIGGRKDRESVVVGTTHFLLLLFYSTFYFYFLLSKWGETMVVPPLTRLFLTSSSRSQRRWSLFNGEEWMNFYSICPFFFLYLSINSFEMRFFFF